MAALAINFCQYIKHEGFHIKVQSLVVQKQLRQQTQVLTIDLKKKIKQHT